MIGTIHIQYFKTNYGELIIGSYGNELCLCDWRYRKMRKTIDERIQSGLMADFQEENSPIIDETKAQISQYLKRESHPGSCCSKWGECHFNHCTLSPDNWE